MASDTWYWYYSYLYCIHTIIIHMHGYKNEVHHIINLLN